MCVWIIIKGKGYETVFDCSVRFSPKCIIKYFLVVLYMQYRVPYLPLHWKETLVPHISMFKVQNVSLIHPYSTEAVKETLLYTKPTSVFPLTAVKLTLFLSRVSEVPTCCSYVGLTPSQNISHHMMLKTFLTTWLSTCLELSANSSQILSLNSCNNC